MRRSTLVAVLALALASPSFQAVAATSSAKPAPCRDAKGKITKCPAAAASATTSKPSLFKSLMAKKATAAPSPSAAPGPSMAMTANKPSSTMAMTASRPSSTMAMTASRPSGGSASQTSAVGATAKCKDGTYWKSASHSGSCSHHGGVAAFL